MDWLRLRRKPPPPDLGVAGGFSAPPRLLGSRMLRVRARDRDRNRSRAVNLARAGAEAVSHAAVSRVDEDVVAMTSLDLEISSRPPWSVDSFLAFSVNSLR